MVNVEVVEAGFSVSLRDVLKAILGEPVVATVEFGVADPVEASADATACGGVAAGVVTALRDLFLLAGVAAADLRPDTDIRRSGITLARRDFGVTMLVVAVAAAAAVAGVVVIWAGLAFAVGVAGLSAPAVPDWARRLAPRVVGASIGGSVMMRPLLRTILMPPPAVAGVAAEVGVLMTGAGGVDTIGVLIRVRVIAGDFCTVDAIVRTTAHVVIGIGVGTMELTRCGCDCCACCTTIAGFATAAAAGCCADDMAAAASTC